MHRAIRLPSKDKASSRGSKFDWFALCWLVAQPRRTRHQFHADSTPYSLPRARCLTLAIAANAARSGRPRVHERNPPRPSRYPRTRSVAPPRSQSLVPIHRLGLAMLWRAGQASMSAAVAGSLIEWLVASLLQNGWALRATMSPFRPMSCPASESRVAAPAAGTSPRHSSACARRRTRQLGRRCTPLRVRYR